MFDLDQSIVSSRKSNDLLLDNRFEEALEFTGKYADHSLLHAHVHSLLLGLKAFFEPEMIPKAQISSQSVLRMCDSIRPPTFRDKFLLDLFFQANYEKFTDLEIHCELIRIEQTLFSAFIELAIDTSLFVLVKLSYRVRKCYHIYRSLHKIREIKQWSSDVSKKEFDASVNVGFGLLNLAFSLIPERLLGLLSLIGFKGSRRDGMRMLNEAAFSDALRSFPAMLIVSFYECYFQQIFSVHTVPVNEAKKIIHRGLRINASCCWFLVNRVRLHYIEHDVPGALRAFEQSADLTFELKNIGNLYTWETLCCHLLLGNWIKARDLACKFRENCNWSITAAYYLEAVVNYMILESRLIADDESENFSKSKECAQIRMRIDALLSEAPRHVRRYAGRRLPMDKFVCDKIEKYNQQQIFVAPVYEVLLIWNFFIFIEDKPEMIEPILSHIDQCFRKYKFINNNESNENVNENYLMLLLLKAVCHRLLRDYDSAESELRKIADRMHEITLDKHLVPFAALEYGIVMLCKRNFSEARHWFDRCKSEASDHALELLVHMRVQGALKQMRKLQQQSPVW